MSLHAIAKIDQPDPALGHQRLKVVRVVTAHYVVPWHLANALKKMPTDFEVCVVGQGVSCYKDVYPDVKWVDIEINRKINIILDLRAVFALCRFFLSYKPDIVHSIMHKAALLTAISGFICRVPIRINTFTGQFWMTKRGIVRALYYASDWLVNSLNTVCLTDSLSQSAFLHKHKISNAGRPLPVLLRGSLSGVDVERFCLPLLSEQAKILRFHLGLVESNFVFMFLARKTYDKGALDILKAFAVVRSVHPSAKLLFVGPDESNGEIDSLYQSKPDIFENVININSSVDNHEVYLAVSDVLCLPSYKEGFGSVVIEAAALGVPTIGSNIPGLVDAIEDGQTGILFPVGDIDALVRVMLDFLRNPKKYEEMRLSAKVRAEKYFSADLIYCALKEFYLELASKLPGRSGPALANN